MHLLNLGKYWRKDGGIETHVKSLCKGLASTGVSVVNLVSSLDGKRNQFSIDGYNVVETPTLGVYFGTSMSPRMVQEARRLHAEERFDIIHLHFPDPMSHLASLALPEHIPRVITWHSDIVKQRRLFYLYRPLMHRIIKHSKAIVAATPSQFRNSTQLPRDYVQGKLQVIPFGFDFEWLTATSNVLKRAHIIRSQTQGRFLLFALGRHVAYKGFDVLIDAMSRTQAFLILGGEGPLTAALKAKVQRLGLCNRVKFTGRLHKADVAAHYHACDAFCLPSDSLNETFGIVQVEAMACGKPVICTQLCNGVNDVNPHGVTGLTVRAGDSEALSGAIDKLSNDAVLRKLLGKNARLYALSEFSLANMVNNHLKLYNSLVRDSNSQQDCLFEV